METIVKIDVSPVQVRQARGIHQNLNPFTLEQIVIRFLNIE